MAGTERIALLLRPPPNRRCLLSTKHAAAAVRQRNCATGELFLGASAARG